MTPKVEVRGDLIDEGDRLLMMREVADGRWLLPGGFADPLDTPSEAAVTRGDRLRRRGDEAGRVLGP